MILAGSILFLLAVAYALMLAVISEPIWRRRSAPTLFVLESYRPLTMTEALILARPAVPLPIYDSPGAGQ